MKTKNLIFNAPIIGLIWLLKYGENWNLLRKITAKFARIFRFIDDIPKNLTVYRQTT